MKLIELPDGLKATVDDEDFERASRYRWHSEKAGNLTYVKRRIRTTFGKKRVVYLHDFILGKSGVDHRDCNGLNNTRNNLRMACQSKNGANHRINKNNTSGFKGVFWHRTNKKWIASIRVNYKQKYLGCFQTPVDAAKAYDIAATEHFGEFARTNKMEGVL